VEVFGETVPAPKDLKLNEVHNSTHTPLSLSLSLSISISISISLRSYHNASRRSQVVYRMGRVHFTRGFDLSDDSKKLHEIGLDTVPSCPPPRLYSCPHFLIRSQGLAADRVGWEEFVRH
jgi:hypothetical protein